HIREADAICQVTRVFDDPDVVHVEGRVDPAGDIETVSTELILADLQTLEKAIPRLEKEVRAKKASAAELAACEGAKEVLERGTTLSAGAGPAGVDLSAIRELSLLTAKPFVYVFNADERVLGDANRRGALA